MNVTPRIYGCDEILPEHVDGQSHLGLKAMGLRRLRENGYCVPAFFTISTEVCAAYYKSNRQLPEGLLDEVCERVDRLHPTQDSADALVAVRSGAPVSMPGALETALGVQVTAAALESAIKTVLDSWVAAPAVAYRRAFQIDDAIGTAVTVQEMIDTECAGVLFSAMDTESGQAEMRMEFVQGSGKQVVDGSKNPSEIRILRGDLEAAGLPPLDVAMDHNRVRELCDVALRIESLLGHPVDIEWGYDAERLYLFQVRRLPTASDTDAETSASICEKELKNIRGLAADGPRVRHSLHESVPAPTPLTWTVLQRLMSGGGGFGNLYRRLGFDPSPRVCQEGFLELIGGRIYANPGRQAELFEPWPLRYELNSVTDADAILDVAPTVIDVDRIDSMFLFRIPWLVWKTRCVRGRVAELTRSAATDFHTYVEGEYLDRLQLHQAGLEQADEQRLASSLERLCDFVLEEAAPRLLLPGLLGGHAWNTLRTTLKRWLGEVVGDRVARELVHDVEINDSPMVALMRHSSAGDDVNSLLKKYGHRCFDEMELSSPRWQERPIQFQEMVNDLKQAEMAKEALDAAHVPASTRLQRELAEAGLSSLAPQLSDALRYSRQLLPYREQGRHYLMYGFGMLRQLIERIASRTDLGEAVYFLELDELKDALKGKSFQDEIHLRRTRWQALQTLKLPVVLGSTIPAVGQTRAEKAMGKSLSLGVERGKVWHLAAANDAPPESSVLLCSCLAPNLLAHLPHVKAIIAEQGGYLSHVALVARALRIPVIIIPNASELYRADEDVTVNADQGEVHRHAADSEGCAIQ